MAFGENASTAWRRIADELAETIRTGTYEMGSGLPTTVEIATHYKVHRHTASKALHFLREQGLVSVEQGRGSFVRGARYPYRINEKVSFRKNFADTGLTVQSRLLDVLTIAIPSTVAQALQLSANSSVWRIVLRNSVDQRAISLSIHYLPVQRFTDFAQKLKENDNSISKAFQACGVASYQRKSTKISARIATDEEYLRLELSEGDPVMTTEGIDVDDALNPLQVVETSFNPNRIQFIVD